VSVTKFHLIVSEKFPQLLLFRKLFFRLLFCFSIIQVYLSTNEAIIITAHCQVILNKDYEAWGPGKSTALHSAFRNILAATFRFRYLLSAPIMTLERGSYIGVVPAGGEWRKVR
jgi:hypothetical protein